MTRGPKYGPKYLNSSDSYTGGPEVDIRLRRSRFRVLVPQYSSMFTSHRVDEQGFTQTILTYSPPT